MLIINLFPLSAHFYLFFIQTFCKITSSEILILKITIDSMFFQKFYKYVEQKKRASKQKIDIRKRIFSKKKKKTLVKLDFSHLFLI